MPTETDWYSPIVDLAHQFGWLVHHGRAAKGQSGKWSTPIMGDTGYPDFTFSHPDRRLVMFREVKGARTRVDPAQTVWLRSLADAGADADLWRFPNDWQRAVGELSFGRAVIPVPARLRT